MYMYIFILGACLLLINPQGSKDLSGMALEELIQKARDYSDKEPEKSLYYSYSALTRARNERNLQGEVQALSCIGLAYTNQGAFGIGFEYFHDAYLKCPSTDKKLFSTVCKYMARSYWKHKEFDKALDILSPAFDLAKEGDDSLSMAECYNIKGLIYMGKRQKDSCIVYWKKALEINRRLGNRIGMAQNLNNICIFSGTENWEAMLGEAIRINQEIGSNYGLAENYNNMGNQYCFRGNYKEALECFDRAENYAQKFGAKELLCDNYDYRVNAYRKMNNFYEAFLCLEKLRTLEKEVYSRQRLQEIASMDSDRKFKAEQQKQELRARETELRKLRRQSLSAVVTLILVLASIGVYLHFRFKSQERKITLKEIEQEHEIVKLRLENTEIRNLRQEDEIDRYKKELNRFAYYILNRNDLLEKIKSQIKELARIDPSEVKSYSKRIHFFISQNQMEDRHTEEFVKELEKINEDFLQRLMERHPDLTRNEKQLASMLRIELSSREIAILQGVETKTISIARYRLRKRLGLESEANLSEYMKSV